MLAVQQQMIPADNNVPKNAGVRLKIDGQKCIVTVAKLFELHDDGEEQNQHKNLHPTCSESR